MIIGLLAFVFLYWQNRYYLAFGCLFMAMGGLAFYIQTPNPMPREKDGEVCLWSGRIVKSFPSTIGQACIVEIDETDRHPVSPFNARIVFNSISPELLPGMRIGGKCRLRTVKAESILPSELQYQNYLLRQGIVAQGAVMNSEISVLEMPQGYNDFVNKARSQFYNLIVDSPISGGTCGMLTAVLIGDPAFLRPDLKETYRMTGVSHILAISGMHVGILAGIVIFMLLPLGLFRHGFAIRITLAMMIVWAYVIIIGMPSSAVRAAIMLSVYLMARFSKYGSSSINSMLLALSLILIIRPMDLFSPGLQLSFAAVASILAFPQLVPDAWRKKPILYYMANIVALPVIAMLGTGLLTAFHFHALPLHFIGANAVIGLFFPWFLTIGVAICLFGALGLPCAFLGRIEDAMYDIMDNWIHLMASFRAPIIEDVNFSAWTFVPYAVGVLALALAWKNREVRRVAQGHFLTAAGAFLITGTIVMLTASSAEAIEISRGSGVEELNEKIDGVRVKWAGQYVWIDGHWVRIISTSPMQPTPEIIKPTYAIIDRGYPGGAAEAFYASKADTLVLSATLHARRASTLRKQCGDSIPYIDLRSRGILINHQK